MQLVKWLHVVVTCTNMYWQFNKFVCLLPRANFNLNGKMYAKWLKIVFICIHRILVISNVVPTL